MTARLFPLLCLLLLLPVSASADVITRTGENSFLIYGGPTAYYFGNGINFHVVPAYDPEGDDSAYAEFSIDMNTLVSTSFDAGASTYRYGDGQLMMWVQSPFPIGGFFFADVLDLTITVLEIGTRQPNGYERQSTEVVTAFQLGAGGFETSSTRPTIGFNRTRGGSVVDQWLYGDDYPSDPERLAREGYPELTLETVPEPSLLALLALGVAPLLARRVRGAAGGR